ncbi:MAG TPA: hypothetical protein VIL68_05885 [Propionibacteriaceae bacterium]
MSAWWAMPWWVPTLCIAILAALVVGAVGISRDIRRDLRDPPP